MRPYRKRTRLSRFPALTLAAWAKLDVNLTAVLPLRADHRKPFASVNNYATLVQGGVAVLELRQSAKGLTFYDSAAELVAPQWFTSDTTSAEGDVS